MSKDATLKKEVATYNDGITVDVARHLKKRGIQVKSKEGVVKKATDANKSCWEVSFPQGKASADYSYRRKEWSVNSWKPNK